MNGDGRRRDQLNWRRNQSKQKLRLSAEEVLEAKLGFDLFTEGEKRLGWLLTLAPVSTPSLLTSPLSPTDPLRSLMDLAEKSNFIELSV